MKILLFFIMVMLVPVFGNGSNDVLRETNLVFLLDVTIFTIIILSGLWGFSTGGRYD